MNRFQIPFRVLAVGCIAMAGVAFASCGDDDNKTAATKAASGSTAVVAASQAATVKIGDNKFTDVTIAKGGKVTWDWTSSQNPHSVAGTSANAKDLLKSERFSGGKGNYEVSFPAAGVYDYQCGVHGSAMTGKVTVQ